MSVGGSLWEHLKLKMGKMDRAYSADQLFFIISTSSSYGFHFMKNSKW